MTTRGLKVTMVLAAMLLAVAAAPEPMPKAMKALADCRAIADNAARLACYDAAAAGVGDAIAKKDVVVLGRDEITRARRGIFGFALPQLSFLKGTEGKESARDEVEEIDTELQAARESGFGLWQLTMADGALWTTTEPFAGRSPRAGSKVHIKRGALGSYFLKVDGGRAVKARRAG